MDDIRVVMDETETDRAVLLADHDAVCFALLFAATYPDRVTGLVLTSISGPRTRWAPDYPIGLPDDDLDRYIDWVGHTWGSGRVMSGFTSASPEDARASTPQERAVCTPAMAQEHFRRANDLDVRDAVPAVHVPTLVIHGTREILPIAWARYLAEQLDDAALLEVDGLGLMEPDLLDPLIDAIEEFVTGERPRPAVEIDRVLATVLFVDIATSTEHLLKVGDRRWSETIVKFREQVRDELARHRGREINTRGDDVLATFDGSTRAIRCTQEIARAAKTLGVEVRAGLHTGEIELQGDDIAGIAVHLGARVGALAAPGQILVTSTLRELVAGSGLEFVDAGVHELKGVPGLTQLFAVVSTGADEQATP